MLAHATKAVQTTLRLMSRKAPPLPKRPLGTVPNLTKIPYADFKKSSFAKETANCGLGFVLAPPEAPSRTLVERVSYDCQLEHRGAAGADPETSDGQSDTYRIHGPYFQKILGTDYTPHEDFLLTICLPKDKEQAEFGLRRIIETFEKHGIPWNGHLVPLETESRVLGPVGRSLEPSYHLGYLKNKPGFQAQLFKCLCEFEALIQADIRNNIFSFFSPPLITASRHFISFNSPAKKNSTYFKMLQDPEFISSFGAIHVRFANNSATSLGQMQGTWGLSTFYFHNGDKTRAPFYQELLRQKGIQTQHWSDTRITVKLMDYLNTEYGLSLPEILLLFFQENNLSKQNPTARFHQLTSPLKESGPSSIASSTDGITVYVAKNPDAFRPGVLESYTTEEGQVMAIFGSERGMFLRKKPKDIQSHRIVPGQVIEVTHKEGALQINPYTKSTHEDAHSQALARFTPLRGEGSPKAYTKQETERYAKLGQLDLEVLETTLAPMIRTGTELTGSMGYQAPADGTRELGFDLAETISQVVANITTPPRDPHTEGLNMSAEHCISIPPMTLDHLAKRSPVQGILLESPFLTETELDTLIKNPLIKAKIIDMTFEYSFSVEEAKSHLEKIVKEVIETLKTKREINTLVFSDKEISTTRIGFPPILVIGAVHAALEKEIVDGESLRERVHFMVQTVQCSLHHNAVLITNFGVVAINNWLSYAMAKTHFKDVPTPEAIKNIKKTYTDAALRSAAKMGFANIQNGYSRIAATCAEGLDPEFAESIGVISVFGDLTLEYVIDRTLKNHRYHQGLQEHEGRLSHSTAKAPHFWNPSIRGLFQSALRLKDFELYQAYEKEANAWHDRYHILRDLKVRRLPKWDARENPFPITILGTGPSAIQLTIRLLQEQKEKDLPWVFYMIGETIGGLGKYGIAPDHSSKQFPQELLLRLAKEDRVKMAVGVRLKDADISELTEASGVVFNCTGIPQNRDLQLPGQNLRNREGAALVLPASVFTNYYNSLFSPYIQDVENPLVPGTTLELFGFGNVSIDIARLVAKAILKPDSLDKSELSSEKVAELARLGYQELRITMRSAKVWAAQAETSELKELIAVFQAHNQRIIIDCPAPQPSDLLSEKEKEKWEILKPHIASYKPNAPLNGKLQLVILAEYEHASYKPTHRGVETHYSNGKKLPATQVIHSIGKDPKSIQFQAHEGLRSVGWIQTKVGNLSVTDTDAEKASQTFSDEWARGLFVGKPVSPYPPQYEAMAPFNNAGIIAILMHEKRAGKLEDRPRLPVPSFSVAKEICTVKVVAAKTSDTPPPKRGIMIKSPKGQELGFMPESSLGSIKGMSLSQWLRANGIDLVTECDEKGVCNTCKGTIEGAAEGTFPIIPGLERQDKTLREAMGSTRTEINTCLRTVPETLETGISIIVQNPQQGKK